MALGKALILRSRRRRRLEGGTALVHLISSVYAGQPR
jgi:hypothetical protein